MWTCSQIEGRNLDMYSDQSEPDFGFLSDPRLLNAAMTRAQSLLAIVGDPMSLCSVGACRNLWKDFLHRCDANKGLYGCTLKIVMDFCLSSQVLDPRAHEFLPSESAQVENEEILTSSSSKGEAFFIAIHNIRVSSGLQNLQSTKECSQNSKKTCHYSQFQPVSMSLSTLFSPK